MFILYQICTKKVKIIPLVPLKHKTPRNIYTKNIGFKFEILYHFPKINIAQHYVDDSVLNSGLQNGSVTITIKCRKASIEVAYFELHPTPYDSYNEHQMDCSSHDLVSDKESCDCEVMILIFHSIPKRKRLLGHCCILSLLKPILILRQLFTLGVLPLIRFYCQEVNGVNFTSLIGP